MIRSNLSVNHVSNIFIKKFCRSLLYTYRMREKDNEPIVWSNLKFVIILPTHFSRYWKNICCYFDRSGCGQLRNGCWMRRMSFTFCSVKFGEKTNLRKLKVHMYIKSLNERYENKSMWYLKQLMRAKFLTSNHPIWWVYIDVSNITYRIAF